LLPMEETIPIPVKTTRLMSMNSPPMPCRHVDATGRLDHTIPPIPYETAPLEKRKPALSALGHDPHAGPPHVAELALACWNNPTRKSFAS